MMSFITLRSKQEVVFSDKNDQTVQCSYIVAQPYMDTLLNIYVSTAVVLQHYERLLTSFFPNPPCQTLKFNIPFAFKSDFYQQYPRIIAILLNT